MTIMQSISELINKLYEMQDYYRLHTSIQEKTNLDLLFEKAIQFEAKEAGSLESFLAQIDQIQDAQTAEAIPVGSEADVVRVMSIHQSKGLQFPVVFLWSSDKQTPIEFKDFCILDAELGIGMKAMELPKRYVRTTLPRIAMEHKKDKEELEEEMLQKINQLGIGPGGLGGVMTALAVNVNTYPTHIAGLPVAVNICCHVNRHIVRVL